MIIVTVVLFQEHRRAVTFHMSRIHDGDTIAENICLFHTVRRNYDRLLFAVFLYTNKRGDKIKG